MKIAKVENNPGLVRDMQSHGILNIDQGAYERHKKLKKQAKEKLNKELGQETRINTLEQKVNTLDDKLNKILELLNNVSR